MKAIILAAGRGSRMKHLTEEHPKCLIKLNGKPLIDWQIETIKSAGITEIAIVTGYKNNLLNNRGLVEFFNHRWETTNMVTSLICADSWLNNNDCIVSYSDIFYKKSAIKSLVDNKSNLAITFDPNWEELWSKRFGDPLLDAETFKLKNNKFLAEIGKPPNLLKEIEGQYMGLLKFTPKNDYFQIKNSKNLETITKVLFNQRRKMIKKSLNSIFKNRIDIAKKLNLNLNLRPQNLSRELYYEITREYENLIK